MKVVQIPFCFHPDPIGGTEVYVESLSRNLRKRGWDAVVAAPGTLSLQYEHQGLPVRRFAVSQQIRDATDMYGEGDQLAADEFARVLDQEKPDLVHMHAFTRGASLRLARTVKARGIPLMFTYHTPTVSCHRGTLLFMGRQVCDGHLDVHRCSVCTLHGLGMIRPAAAVVGRLPVGVGRWLGNHGRSGGVWTALRMTGLMERRHAFYRSLMEEADHVVAVCQWVRELLIRTGVPVEKISLSRQGLSQSLSTPNPESQPLQSNSDKVRLVFIGRLERVKGPDILIRAVRSDQSLPVQLDVFGIAQGESGKRYERELRQLAADDPRISFKQPVPSNQIIELLRGYDLLAVPSQWLETGPLVVLEAFAAGIPVVGSDLGGIAELVKNETDGLLVPADSVDAWTNALRRCCEDKRLLPRLRGGTREPKTMETVSEEMIELYGNLLSKKASARLVFNE